MTEEADLRRRTDHGFLRPVDARAVLLLLASMGCYGVKDYRSSRENEQVSQAQVQQLGAARTRYEALQERCENREMDHLWDAVGDHDKAHGHD